MVHEIIVLAAAIEAGNGPLPPFTEKIIKSAPDSFDDQRAGQVAAIVHAMRRVCEPVSFASIGEKHTPFLDFITGELAASALPIDEAEYRAKKCWQAFQTRRAKSIGAELIEKLVAAPEQVTSIIAATSMALSVISSEMTGGLPMLIDAVDFLAVPIDPPDELVEGILHVGSKLAFGGSSKSFKTWSLLDLAISVASGAPWLGRSTTQGKVLFVNFEIQPHAWQRRIAAVAAAKGVEIKPGTIQLLNLRGYAASYQLLIPRIIERARGQGFALIVLDPIYKLYGGRDENSTGDMAEVMNALESLAVETGAAIAYGAHFAKGNASAKEPMDRISGSGVFARDPDSLLIFTKHETDHAFAVDAILRNFASITPFVVRWEFPLMQLADDLDPSKLKQVGGRKKEHDSKKLLAVIVDTTPENPISISAWAVAGKVARQTLTGYLPEMRRNNWIRTVGDGNTARQCITDGGRAFLNENQA